MTLASRDGSPEKFWKNSGIKLKEAANGAQALELYALKPI